MKAVARIVRFAGWLFSAFFIALIALASMLAFWAYTGPRDLSAYLPTIEESLNDITGNSIKIGSAKLAWGNDEMLFVQAADVTVADAEGNKIATMPAIDIKYSIISLVTLNPIPSKIKLVNPNLDLSHQTKTGNKQGVDVVNFDLNRLDEVEIENGALIAPDGRVWAMPSAKLWYAKRTIFVSGALTGENELIGFHYRNATNGRKKILGLSLNNINSAMVTPYINELDKFKFVADGTVGYSIIDGQEGANFDITKFTGTIVAPEIFPKKLTFNTLVAKGEYDMAGKNLSLKTLDAVMKDGFTLHAKAEIRDFKSFDIDAKFSGMKTSLLKKYWPLTTAKNARAWAVANITGGAITEGTAKVNIKPEDIELGKLPKEAIDLNFKFSGMKVTYFENLIPVSEAVGNGHMDGNSVTFTPESGKLGSSVIKSGEIKIYDIGENMEKLSVKSNIEGPPSDLIGYYLRFGTPGKVITKDTVLKGTAASSITLSLPMSNTLEIKDVPFELKSVITNSEAESIFGKASGTNIKLDLLVNNDSYSVKGNGLMSYNDSGIKLENAPTNFEATQNKGVSKISADVDLTNTKFQFDSLGISKSGAEKASAQVVIDDDGVNPPKLSKLEISSSAASISASGTIAKGYENVGEINIAQAKFGKSDFKGKISNNKVLSVNLSGPSFDAGPLIKSMNSDDEEDESKYSVDLKVGKLYLAGNEQLDDVDLSLTCMPDCNQVTLLSKQSTVSLNETDLLVKADDAGNFLRGFDVYDNMSGGKLEVNAKVNGKKYDGRILVTDFKISKAQILAKMLTVGSLTGIADTLRGKGIRFSKLASEFKMDEGEINVKDFRMVGPAIGITANGSIKRQTDIADISGNIIPAYTANTLLGKIPLIGDVLIGNDGVFALAYSLKGNMNDPDLSVNPLSVLAPGFLKGIFQ